MSKKSATKHAYRFIKEVLLHYQWIPGQKITYEELIKRIKLSKTPIISALNRLEQEDFVVSV